jgi:transposase
MASWLKSCGIDTVAMQSTGVYWFAVYDVLERHGLKVFLINASHTTNLPGRKSDVQESQWLVKLHTLLTGAELLPAAGRYTTHPGCMAAAGPARAGRGAR